MLARLACCKVLYYVNRSTVSGDDNLRSLKTVNKLIGPLIMDHDSSHVCVFKCNNVVLLYVE